MSVLPCNVRDELKLSCSAQVSDVIGYRLYSPPTPSAHPHSATNTHPTQKTHTLAVLQS